MNKCKYWILALGCRKLDVPKHGKVAGICFLIDVSMTDKNVNVKVTSVTNRVIIKTLLSFYENWMIEVKLDWRVISGGIIKIKVMK